MDQVTHFEDLSSEIFFQIFDYIHAFDIFKSFSSLNQRITAILDIIPLRVVILPTHSWRQINFLSSHLRFHEHQVISLKISDVIFDCVSTVSLIFRRHKFINLQLCSFTSIRSPNILNYAMEQLKSLDKLVSYTINQHSSITLNDGVVHDLFQPMLLHKSPYLRSLVLEIQYNYRYISSYLSISPNIRSLHLHMYSSTLIPLIDLVTSILRLCYSLRYLDLTLECGKSTTILFTDLTDPLEDEHDSIVSQTLTTFNLKILAYGDHRAIPHLLHAMPNLQRFYFYLNRRKVTKPYARELLNGHLWKQMLDDHAPNLSQFEFYMIITKEFPLLNIHEINASFIPISRQYPDWNMIIDQWTVYKRNAIQHMNLRTLNYRKVKSQIYESQPVIVSDSLRTVSIGTTDHHEFYQDITDMAINLTKEKPTVACCSSLYQQVSKVTIELPTRTTTWYNLWNIVTNNQTSDIDAHHIATNLSQFFHLPTLTSLAFGSTSDVSRWKEIQYILQSCPNVTSLELNGQLLLYSKIIDNPLLISSFQRIKKITSKTNVTYFSRNSVLKLIDRFPSLIQIELLVHSFGICLCMIDIFLNHLRKLSFVEIYFREDMLLNCKITRDYVIQKRRENFPDEELNEEMVNAGKYSDSVLVMLS